MITVNGFLLNVTTFPNNERTVSFGQEHLKDEDYLEIIWKYESDSEVFLIKLLEDYIQTNCKDTTVVYCHLPYMPYSRMDRVQAGNTFSLQVFISLLPVNWNYCVYEPHSNVTVTEFDNSNIRGSNIVRFITPQLLPKVFWNSMLAQHLIVLPDKGAYDRYILGEGTLPIHPTSVVVYGEKTRDFETGDITGLELVIADDPNMTLEKYMHLRDSSDKSIYYDAIIVDDLSSYGGTFVRVAKKLKEVNVRKISLVTAHAEESIKKGVLFDHIDHMYTTNSMNNLPQESGGNLTITDFSLFIMKKEYLMSLTKDKVNCPVVQVNGRYYREQA